ncbi:MAG: FAD-binding oxidoreductase, partial [Gammaproteobacteria bacterium]|nr:FAD-binding oxidoreductase [Gammaproteobacteria bacterium]
MSNQFISLWDETAPLPPELKSLSGDASVDVVIVGGGFTGCSAALHLAKGGVDALLLEANKIGYGGSGRNVGLVNAGVWLPPRDASERLGGQQGQRLVKILSEAPDIVFSLIDQYQIECEARHNGTIHVAHSTAGFKDLSQRAEQWQALGAPVELLSKEQTAKKTRSDIYHGGLLDRRAGTINPMGYVRGLARAAVNAGAKLHVGTRVTRLLRNGDKWTVQTPDGTINAQHIIVATNAYGDHLWPELPKTFTPMNYYQVATKPLGERVNNIVPDREGIWDTAPIMSSLRIDMEDRLILGSMGKIMGADGIHSRRWADRTLKHMFPQLGHVEWEYFWHGNIALTPTRIPSIYNPAPGLLCPMGYNGRGIAPGTVFGKAVAEYLVTGDEAVLPQPLTKPAVDTFRGIKCVAMDVAFKTRQ